MDSGGEVPGLMAETLIVLAGENAWSAARSFGSESVRDGDLTEAQYWRSVARAVLREYAARVVDSAGESATPDAAPAAPEAPAETNEAPAATPETPAEMPSALAPGANEGSAPIPLRARRNSQARAMTPEGASTNASVEGNAAEEVLVARAA